MSNKGGIPSEVIDRVRDETDIVKLIERDVELKKQGSAWLGCCPFHDEKTPSFRVDVARRRYKCFGCDKSGDVFEWLVAQKGMSFPEAVRALAAEAGIEVPAADEALPPPEPGRLDVAVGVGGREQDYRALGSETGRRFARLDAAVATALDQLDAARRTRRRRRAIARAGDTWARLAARELGDYRRADELVELNGAEPASAPLGEVWIPT